jgi:uncharacterized protein YcfL
MKKLTFVLLTLLIGVVACDSDTANKAIEEAATNIESVENNATEVVAETTSAGDESLITPADISEEAQKQMYQFIFDYNQCMMATRLTTTQQSQQVQQTANDIMTSCESHMEALEAHLLANNVNESLVIGMTKKMRSRAARKLMTQSMNQMAAQAAAAANAEKMQAESE